MNTDEKNRYICEVIGYVVAYNSDVPLIKKPEQDDDEYFYMPDHYSNASDYVVPYMLEHGLIAIEINWQFNSLDTYFVDPKRHYRAALNMDVDQAICEAFIEYCRGKDDEKSI